MGYLPDLSFGPDTRIVLVGTTKCPSDEAMLPPVPHAERNIDYLSRLFTDPSICGLDAGCIVRVLDRENASEITDEIARAAQEATDTLLVYYVGHGLYGDAETPIYLAAGKTTEAKKTFNGVSINLVRKAMKSSQARKRILILDCCYSGRALDGGMTAQGAEAALAPALDLEGTFGIAAVPANAKALAPPDEKLTRFTGALVDVLENGYSTEDRVLTLDGVFHEVERRIGRKADAPLPKHSNWDKGEKFAIARNRFLHRRELDELYKAIEGLRETMAATGARLQALEAKGTEVGNLPGRLANSEATTPQLDPMLKRLGLTEEGWSLLPAQPYKVHIRRVWKARRSTSVVLAAVLYCGIGMNLLIGFTGRLYQWKAYIYFATSIFFVVSVGLIRAAVGKSLGPLAAGPMLSKEAQRLLSSNEHLAEVMDRRVVDLFGFAFDKNLAIMAAGISLMSAVIGLLQWATAIYLKTP